MLPKILILPVDMLSQILYDKTVESSSPGESHPQALSEPDVTVSRHPAPIIQPTADCLVLSIGSSHFWLSHQ